MFPQNRVRTFIEDVRKQNPHSVFSVFVLDKFGRRELIWSSDLVDGWNDLHPEDATPEIGEGIDRCIKHHPFIEGAHAIKISLRASHPDIIVRENHDWVAIMNFYWNDSRAPEPESLLASLEELSSQVGLLESTLSQFLTEKFEAK